MNAADNLRHPFFGEGLHKGRYVVGRALGRTVCGTYNRALKFNRLEIVKYLWRIGETFRLG
jgi:hypothetical protein